MRGREGRAVGVGVLGCGVVMGARLVGVLGVVMLGGDDVGRCGRFLGVLPPHWEGRPVLGVLGCCLYNGVFDS